ncbi:MAG: chromosome segregation protein SMC [Gammaproteobacteria bacterium]|nr:chromosome segregation protein SMC [Gammaproteobacteria bacterium]
MRLKQIKLAGFKSFVDPTSVPFPDNLTAIVGPNGCGKSNLIDAVRWVMGESSAKNLRGDSMTDVIFNGSSTRKPVGQASIELVFDNSDGTIKGEYANYNEISVRRSVTRDGIANYYLNGTRCRRKDITDIFLGTGLGARSYAIIEQGMISRLIESKPQELRVFLEEAAGISKYKERRRETENRIRHTRENMERLTDIREELKKQLAHLDRQAKSAAKYKEFKQKERQLKDELAAIRWHQFEEGSIELKGQIGKMEVDLEARIADQRNIDNQIEQVRDKHIELTETFNHAQGLYYGIGADIARLEQNLTHKKERRGQLREDVEQASFAFQQLQEQDIQDKAILHEAETALATKSPEMAIRQERVEQSLAHLAEVEQDMAKWESEWDAFNQGSAENSQKVEVERTRIQHYEKVIEKLAERIDKNQKELDELLKQPAEQGMIEASEKLREVELEVEQINQQTDNLREQIGASRDKRQQIQQKHDQRRNEMQQVQSRFISLSAMQKAALGAENSDVESWITRQHLDKNNRLAQNISVESGWEMATEMVLGDFLEAIVTDKSSSLVNELENLASGSLILMNDQNDSSPLSSDGTLASMVSNSSSVSHLLGKVKTAKNSQEALTMAKELDDEFSVITQDGLWLGKNWVRFARSAADESNILQREAEIKTLESELHTLENEVEELSNQELDEREKLTSLEKQWEGQQSILSSKNREYTELRAQVGGQQAKLEQMSQRKDALIKEKSDLKNQMENDEKMLSQSRQLLEKMVDAMAEDMSRKSLLLEQKDTKRLSLEEARRQTHSVKDKAHQLELEVSQHKSEISSVKLHRERIQQQLAELQARKSQLEDNLKLAESPDDELQHELETALEKRLASEQELAKARESLEVADREIRQYEKQRHDAEQMSQSVRSELERLRIKSSENAVFLKNQIDNISNKEKSVEEIFATLDESANEERWEAEIENIIARIQRLGAINLAAIEEYEQQSERKVYLDAQFEDLEESLNTLENAIRKIDKETRTRFKETFDQVNNGMKELFPKVFGGGHAYLEMTGDDLLDTGVTVMARPPGKRNSTIHLLSGGEKALTALSLVFSIFRLNPAPFCMLDEVDAPLDDANVGRFCRLVKEMSDTIQFIYITHNKVSMEMASALAGVTMQEPGASRMVSVDIDEAVQLINQ